MYVSKRNGIYQFRKPIPQDLLPYFGSPTIRLSLRTAVSSVAKVRAARMLVEVDTLFEILRRERPIGDAREIVFDVLQQAIATVTGTGMIPEQRVQQLQKAIDRLGAADTAEKSGAEKFEFDDRLDGLANRIETAIKTAASIAHKARYSDKKLSQAVEDYKNEIAANLQGKHGDDVPRRLSFFRACVNGDPAVRDMAQEDIKRYRDLLDQLPVKFQQRFPGLSAQEIIERNKARVEPFALLDPITIDLKYLGPVRRFFENLVQRDEIEKNVTDGVQSIRDKKRPKIAQNAKRLPLDRDELNAFLKMTVKKSKVSADYWAPRGIPLSGARLNEFSQLHACDLVQHNDRPHLSILCLQDEQDELSSISSQYQDVRHVKSAAARRLIPVHPVLIQLGFLELVKDRLKHGPNTPLFRDVKPDRYGYYSTAISKRLNKLIRKAGVKSLRKSVYSLRHNFASECDAVEMPENIRMKLMGHQIGGVKGIYGNPLPEPNESNWIDQVAYDGVEWR